jgi:hypothetical protein
MTKTVVSRCGHSDFVISSWSLGTSSFVIFLCVTPSLALGNYLMFDHTMRRRAC